MFESYSNIAETQVLSEKTDIDNLPTEREKQEMVDNIVKNHQKKRQTNKPQQPHPVTTAIQKFIKARNKGKATANPKTKKGNTKMSNKLTTNGYFDQLKALRARKKDLDEIENGANRLGSSQHKKAREILNKVKNLKKRLRNDEMDLERDRENAGVGYSC